MANNVANFILKFTTQGQASIDKATASVDKLDNKVNKTAISFKKLATGAAAVASALGIASFIKDSTAAYVEEAEAVAKLSQVMKNTMKATQGETQSILDLASAQQKLGVIGDEAQLAGAQELATYLSKADSLKMLLPVMNDAIAQEKGLNATMQDAATMATMFGKAMNGQASILSRSGYSFSEAEEQVLKFGNETERAATLAAIISRRVQGVNAALADTDFGRMKQLSNTFGDIQEKVGKLWMWFASNVILGAIEGVTKAIDGLVSGFNKLVQGFKDGNPVILAFSTLLVGIGAYLLVTNAGLIAFYAILGIIKIVMVAVTVATKIWTAAMWLLDAAMAANPIGLIIAAIIALIALIAYVASKTEGWGKTWENTVSFMTKAFETFKANLSLKWLQIQDFFMKGIEIIQTGWYKLQSLWNKDAAGEGLSSLAKQRNERAAEIAAAKGKVDELNQQLAGMKVWEVTWNKEKKLSDMVASTQESLGIAPAGIPGVEGTGAEGSVPVDVKKGTESIATGGTRSTNINMNIGKLLETVNIYAQEFSDGMDNLEDKVIEAVTRALTASQSLTR